MSLEAIIEVATKLAVWSVDVVRKVIAAMSRPKQEQRMEDAGGGIQTQVGGDVRGPLTITTQAPVAPESPVAIGLEGSVVDDRVQLSIRNQSGQLHSFRVRFIAAQTVVEGSPQLSRWLPRYLQLEASDDDVWEPIGPHQSATVNFATARGQNSRGPVPYRHLHFHVVGMREAQTGKIHARVAWDSLLEAEIEVQSDADLVDPGPSFWILTLGGKMPHEFNPK